MESAKICPGCLVEKSIEEFNFKNKARGTRQVRCRVCTRVQVKNHYAANHAYYIEKVKRRNKAIKKL